MPIEMWIAFVFAAGTNVLAPGPAIVLAMRNGMEWGPKPAVFSSLGNITAIGIVGMSVAVGLGAVISGQPQMLAALRLFGGGYLVWLGIKAARSGLVQADTTRGPRRPRHPAHRLFGQAMMVGLTNPKMILFLTALFPMFLSRDYPALPQFTVMTVTFMTLSFLVLMTVALSASRLARVIRDARVLLWINRTVALVFSGFGLVMIWIGFLGLMPN